MTAIRTDWTREDIAALFDLPFTELVFRAAEAHRAHHRANEVQLCTLLSIKTGGCPEDCGYCSQSVHADSGVEATKLMDVRAVLQSAARAKDAGSQRFCMGAAWRNPKDRDMPAIAEIVRGVRAMGLETCMTLGMLTPHQAGQLAEAGLDYYNHNIDSSPEYYARVITTRSFQARLDTLEHVRAAATVRTNSMSSILASGVSASMSPSTVPLTGTSALTGTLSGWRGSVASAWTKPTRSSRVSPMPTMPPLHTLIPAARTFSSVSSRSSNLRVLITRS